MTAVTVVSPEISRASLHRARPTLFHIYALPFLSLYPLLAYAYYVKYDEWLRSEEWTFLACVSLGAGHALSFLVTRWSAGARAAITCSNAGSLEQADCVRIVPIQHRGLGEIVPLEKKQVSNGAVSYSFNYQRDNYTFNPTIPGFERLPYPCSASPPLSVYHAAPGVAASKVDTLSTMYGKNEFDIPIPSFTALFAEHATAPFFVFQIFCVALWCLDEYWYYSLFTLFMLIMFEVTVVWQRVRTLKEFRTMSIEPFPIQCLRDNKWVSVQSDTLLPGDVVSIVRGHNETTIPADLLLVRGTCIVNEAMLSGESTPLLKESIELRDGNDKLDMDGVDKGSILFGGTKALQAAGGGKE